MPEMSTITVPTAIRRHPARAHGIPPLRTLSSSPDSGGRRADWLVIRRYGALRRRQNALWKPPAGPSRVPGGVKAPSGAAGALPPTGRAAGVLRLRRLAPGVRFRNGAVVGLCRVLESGGGIVASLRRGPWTGASTPQPAQQITESH